MDGYSISKSARQQKAFKQRVSYWINKGVSQEEAIRIAELRDFYRKPEAARLKMVVSAGNLSKPETCPSRKPDEPTPVEIRREVEKLKLMGLMTEIPVRQEIVSDAQVLSMWKPAESMPQLAFNPSQPIVVPVPTHAEGWKPAAGVTTDLEFEVDWLRLIVCGIGAIICSLALITYGAHAGGNTPEAIFWSTMIVIPGSILLALPFRWRLPGSYVHKALGLGLIVIGYITMHASIVTAEQQTVSTAVAGSTEVQQQEKRIADLEAQLKPTRDAVARLDPIQYNSKISRMQASASPLEDKLSAARDALVSAQNKATAMVSAGTAGSWSLVEWLRRLMLEPLNILCLHGFLESLPSAIKALRRRDVRLAQAAT